MYVLLCSKFSKSTQRVCSVVRDYTHAQVKNATLQLITPPHARSSVWLIITNLVVTKAKLLTSLLVLLLGSSTYLLLAS